MNHKKVYQKAIESIGDTLTIESKVNVVGSANIQRHIYCSDYDLFEEINNKSPGQIYSYFRSIYNVLGKKAQRRSCLI